MELRGHTACIEQTSPSPSPLRRARRPLAQTNTWQFSNTLWQRSRTVEAHGEIAENCRAPGALRIAHATAAAGFAGSLAKALAGLSAPFTIDQSLSKEANPP